MMHRPKALLPPVTSRSNYEAIRINPNIWPQAMRVICQRHGLPTERLKRFGDGTDPAFGSNVVFAVNELYIIKLYPPLQKHDTIRTLRTLKHVLPKLRRRKYRE